MITTDLRAPDTLTRPGQWRALAECAKRDVDPDVMFPELANARGAREARAICRRCPVAVECLVSIMGIEGGTRFGRSGVYAGTSTVQRQELHEELLRTGEPMRPAAERLIGRVLARPRTLRTAFEERVAPAPDGHVVWIRDRNLVTFEGRSYTSTQMAFILGYGREPHGMIRSVCKVSRCVAWRCLTDEPMRRKQVRR